MSDEGYAQIFKSLGLLEEVDLFHSFRHVLEALDLAEVVGVAAAVTEIFPDFAGSVSKVKWNGRNVALATSENGKD